MVFALHIAALIERFYSNFTSIAGRLTFGYVLEHVDMRIFESVRSEAGEKRRERFLIAL